MRAGFAELRDQVIERGLCTGCGTCIGVCPRSVISMEYEQYEPLPALTGKCTPCDLCTKTCPGADIPLPELETFCFGRRRTPLEPLGVHINVGAGWATKTAIRQGGGDGGLVTALLIHALERGWVDCWLLAGFDEKQPFRAVARLATNESEIAACAQSKYVPVPNNSLLHEAVGRGFKKIGVVGVPCHVHALRKIQRGGMPRAIAERIKLVVGLFCGSNFYFQGMWHVLNECCDVDSLADIQKLEYRGGPWPRGLVVESRENGRRTLDRHLYSYHFLLPAYQRDRCMMCTDWANELADLSVGSYWAPSLKPGEEKGRSTVITRTSIGDELLQSAKNAGVAELEKIPLSQVTSSYGFEVKKHGHAHRLKWRQRFGWPTPDYHSETSFAPVRRNIWMAPHGSAARELEPPTRTP